MHRTRTVLYIVVALLATLSFTAASLAQFDALRRLTGSGSDSATKQIAHFKIKGAVTETPTRMPSLFGGERPVSMESLLARFRKARKDPNVVAVVVDLQNAAFGAAQLEEIHQALRKFDAVDKDVYIHADSLSTITYAAATAASHISMVPTGDVWLLGLYGEAPYLRGLLDKIGVVPDFEQFEAFKTAAESITRTGPSAESKEMTAWLLDGIFGTIVDLIAVGRDASSDKVRAWIDAGPYSAEDALAAGLIDSIKHRQDFIAELESRYGKDVEVAVDYAEDDELDMPGDNFFALFEFMMKLFNPAPEKFSKPTIAIVYVEGVIVTGEAEASPFGGQASGAFSTTIRKALDKAADESSVKAVVMRVDSPGGSALASEIILDAAMRVAKKKPLIVSMGNVAGSGGYYVACRAETIFADRATITASIGVIGGKLVTTQMWESLGINWHAVQRGEMAGMMSTASTFNDQERAKIRHYMSTVYDIFKAHVTAGRGSKLTKPINEIAGGRVFTGGQAHKLGLVDEIGGLDDAIKYAAKKAGIVDYDIRAIPEPPSIFDMFLGQKKDEKFAHLAAMAHGSFLNIPIVQASLPTLFSIDPLRARAIVQALRRVELIHKEGVVVMMPQEFLIR